MKLVRTACPLDCWDTCSMEVTIDGEEIVEIKGDPNHPITKGFLCPKGKKHIERYKNPNRITSPLKRVGEDWIAIDWTEAINEISTKLKEILNDYGPTSLINFRDSGHCGLSKNITTAFFNSLGGITEAEGSLCWGAGIAAQKLDFGKVLSHDPEDLRNSKSIFIWGRNPANTNLHLMPFLKEAKDRGCNVILIDPNKTATASVATHHYSPIPEGDGYLAIAMIKLIIANNWQNDDFIMKYTNNYIEFTKILDTISLEEAIEKSGLKYEEILDLARTYALNKPSAIILGYGLQRYENGGKNIRFIDALAAITGNIGIAGGGVSYGNQYISQWIDWSYIKNPPKKKGPSFMKPLFAKYILQEVPQEIKGIFVSNSNPIVQLPDTNKTMEAFKSIPLKVTIDHFMTDTAALSDYVLPCTHIFEEEDFLFSSMWHSNFNFTQQIASPPEGVKHEFDIFLSLAKSIGLTEYLMDYSDREEYLRRGLLPLLKNSGLTLEDMKGKSFKMRDNEIPWQRKVFSTPSRRFEFILPHEADYSSQKGISKDYPLQLLSLHPKNSLHSQHLLDEDKDKLPEVYCNSLTLNKNGLGDGDIVRIISSNGEIKGRIVLDNGVGDNILVIYEGWWLKNQGVNRLTPMGLSDIGHQATYNNCYCRFEKAN